MLNESLAAIIEDVQPLLVGAFLVFVRIGAMVALVPGFGEQSVPSRIKLAAAISFTIIVWPMVTISPVFSELSTFSIFPYILSEALVGLLLGMAIRLVLIALQYAGSIASHAASLAQLMGAAATPDPMPAIGNILVVSGLALALSLGLHVKLVAAIAQSFETLPMGALPNGAEIGSWGMAKCADVAALAFTLSAPFLVASFAYNLVLGFINRAMPQLMVAFIGAPAITASGILILFLAGPALLMAWHENLDAAITTPFRLP